MILLIALLVEIMIANLMNNYISIELLQIIFVIINIFIMCIYLSSKIKRKDIFYIIFFGYLIRVGLMFYDIYIKKLPFSGGDTELFHRFGIKIAELLPNELLDVQVGIYAQFIGIIYYLMRGAARIFLQNINIIVFIISTIKLLEILYIYKVKEIYIKKFLVFYLYMLIPLFESCILLREAIIIFFMTYSINLFIKYVNEFSIKNLILSYLCVFLAAIFHSGVIFILIPYSCIVIFYDFSSRSFKFTFKSLFIFIIILSIVLIGFNILGEKFIHIKKLTNIDKTIEGFNNHSIAESSGSGYLTNLNVQGIPSIILATPIKLVYFLFSPMPWDFRGIMDISVFILDAAIYLYIILKLTSIKKYKNKLPVKIYNIIVFLFLSYIVVMIPYSWGTVAAGTAIRHRAKCFFMLLLAIILFKNYKDKY